MKLVCKAEARYDGLTLYYPSEDIREQLYRLMDGANKKFGGFVSVDIKKPYKARTTGKGSQNSLFWRLAEYISNDTGEDITSVENDLKLRAIKRGYPYRVSKITGQPKPYSMTEIDTVQMSYLIDTAYEVCAFLGIELEPEAQKENYDIF